MYFSAASPIFQKMFQIQGKEGRLEIIDFEEETVAHMLKWINSETVELEHGDFESNRELLRAAHKYELESLKNYLVSKLVEYHAQPEKAVRIFEFGHWFENKAMIEMSKKVIKK
jgi:hypothetical protein